MCRYKGFWSVLYSYVSFLWLLRGLFLDALDRPKVIKERVVTNVFGVKKNCRGLGVERTVCVVKIAELLGWND